MQEVHRWVFTCYRKESPFNDLLKAFPCLSKRVVVALVVVLSCPHPVKAQSKFQSLDQALRAYFANYTDEVSYKKVVQQLKSTIGSNSSNAACSVYAFGVLQAVQSMPIFISSSNKNIQSLKISKDESVAKAGPMTAQKWDELISQAQVELQKGLAYRGEVIGEYLSSIKTYCK